MRCSVVVGRILRKGCVILTAVIYARYSSDSQREESIEGQLRECLEYAQHKKITVVNTYIDRALTGKNDDRPNFLRMISDSRKRLFDTIIVWKLDRFARNRDDSRLYKKALRQNGISVVSAKETISAGPEGIILESVLEGIAEYYSADLTEKVIRGCTENALKNKFNGGTLPFGYVIDGEQHFQIDTATAPVVREVFEMYSNGKNMKTIADYLNEKGLRNTRGGKFTISRVTHMLSNRRYIGEYQYREILNPEGIPAIIEKDLFERVQERMAKNKKAPARAKAHVAYLLTTKLFCGKCGALMAGESGTGRSGMYYYYKCSHVKRKMGCDKKSIRKDLIENFVLGYIINMLAGDAFVEKIVDKVITLQGKQDTTLPTLKKQLAKTEKSIQNMLNAIEQGILTPSTKQRLDELENNKQKLEIAILQAEIKKPTLSLEQVKFWFNKFRETNLSSEEQRQFLVDNFINAVYLYDDHIVITFNFREQAKTVSLAEVNGSDFNTSAAPWNRYSNFE